jgi:sodium-dependent phosphate cotransporter
MEPEQNPAVRTTGEQTTSQGVETAVAGPTARARIEIWGGRFRRLAVFVISLSLFVLAIELIKEGATGAALLIGSYLDIDHALNALGFGWFASYLVMSGSPVAAVSVAFLAAGALESVPAYAMIVGSRLGASFIVLFIGFVYVVRGQERRTGLAMGLLSMLVTASVYLPALAVGALLLRYGILDAVQFEGGTALSSVFARALGPLIGGLSALLPGWGVMLVGLAILWVSFYLFDRALPQLDLEQSRFSGTARLIYRPLMMFILGGALTMITLSVSLSLSLLVPLSARGFVRRENAIPYIMGANITTFVDTLLATLLLGSGDAFTVVLVSMISVMLVSLAVLVLFFRPYERAMLGVVDWATASNRNLALFIATILCMPLVLLLI